ncbi:P-loop NTPase fold protein, partial [Roseburia inulinivorans]|uniref:P-loop NTPase fold protein n=1 Tax=Roseburia inulinivorans TaxID=360807 RepID=UPI001FAAA5BC
PNPTVKSIRFAHLSNIKKAKDLESKIAEFFESILPERGNRMVVFIDELDRCKPDYAIRLLERIKHYFGNERITFVFSLNMDELQHTIRKFYGNDFDACRYLERFFDFRIELPKPDMRRFYDDIGLENGSWVYESVCKQVVEMFNMGLREIAKFYRVAKTVAYKPTHKEHDQWLFIFSDGAGRRFCCLCIVPLMIGLSMCDRPRYNKFIQGRDGSPLIELLSDTNIAISMCSQLLNEKEAYSNLDNSSELIVVKREDKLREVYNAIFVKKYDGRSYETTIGKVSFGEETKNELLKIISGLTEYADYEI